MTSTTTMTFRMRMKNQMYSPPSSNSHFPPFAPHCEFSAPPPEHNYYNHDSHPFHHHHVIPFIIVIINTITITSCSDWLTLSAASFKSLPQEFPCSTATWSKRWSSHNHNHTHKNQNRHDQISIIIMSPPHSNLHTHYHPQSLSSASSPWSPSS